MLIIESGTYFQKGIFLNFHTNPTDKFHQLEPFPLLETRKLPRRTW